MTRDERLPLGFSRKLNVEHLTAKKHVNVEASAEECLSLALNMKILEIDWVKAQFVISPWKGRVGGVPGQGVQVTGCLDAQLVQPCSITLERVSEHINEEIKYKYVMELRGKSKQHYDKEIDFDIEADDPPEVLIEGEIDLGAMAAEVLGLAINPYPRKEGVQFEPHEVGDESVSTSEEIPEKTRKEPKNNPFSLLSRLKPDPE